jgi:hypothetical protein
VRLQCIDFVVADALLFVTTKLFHFLFLLHDFSANKPHYLQVTAR